MKAADLVALAAAHGLDISHTVACETDTKGVARMRPRTPEERRQGMPVRESVEGRQSRVTRPRYWTHAETGMGGGGCKRLPWLAACYSWAGDRDGYCELHRGLTLEAIRMAERGKWPWQVVTLTGQKTYYIERLTEMVLDEEGCRPAFLAAPGLYAVYMGVDTSVWHKPLFGYFTAVQERYQRWLDIAKGTIGQKLRQDVATAEARQ